MAERNKNSFRFKGRDRSKDDVKRASEASFRDYDSIYVEGTRTFAPKEGDYTLRILPVPDTASSEQNDFAYPVYVHYGIGADNQTYLCNQKMLNKGCPICIERTNIQKKATEEELKELAPKGRLFVYVINRDSEEDGPLVWSAPRSMIIELRKLCYDKRTDEALFIDDHEEGYDIFFSKTGTGLHTKYSGLKIDRNSTSLSENEKMQELWLEHITEYPLTDVLNYYSFEHINRVFSGSAPQEDEQTEQLEITSEATDNVKEEYSSDDDADVDSDTDDPPWEEDEKNEQAREKLKRRAGEMTRSNRRTG